MGCLIVFGLILLAGSLPLGWDGIGGTATGLLVLWFAWDMRGDRSHHSTYRKPRVTGARVAHGVGQLEVESSHSMHVAREMNLPGGSSITIVERNQRYLVTFDTPCKHTPDVFDTTVYKNGREFKERIHYNQQDADRNYVRDVARLNGYEGKVE